MEEHRLTINILKELDDECFVLSINHEKLVRKQGIQSDTGGFSEKTMKTYKLTDIYI